jgi:hypothetical protein
MASLLASLLIKLGLDSGEFKSGLSVAEKDLKKATRQIEKIGKSMVNTGQQLSMAVTLPMAAMAGVAVKGALDQRAAIAQVEAAIASMGNIAGRTAEQLAKNADALEMNSLVDADVILTKVTANLLTFGNVAGEVFDRAQQSAIDMAQRMGSDPQAAAIMLGKALNDPIKGITALTRVGVQFTAAQKAQIKAFAETGQVAKAQGIILAEVERQFAGAAKAAADASPWRQATVAINQAADAFGEALLPIIPPITDAVVRVAQAFASLSPQMQQTVLIAAAVAAAFGPVLVGIGSVTAALAGRLAPALLAYRASLAATVTASGAAAAASRVLAIALRGLMIATGVGAAIAALAAAYYLLTGRTREATAASRAKELQSIRTEAAIEIERKATEELVASQGKERSATLAAMQASRARAAQSLQSAAAKLKDARASLALAQAESNRRIQAATQSSRGAGGGTDSAMVELYRRGRVIDPANAQLKAAEEKYAKAMGQLDGLDRAIRQNREISMPTINVPALDAGSAAAGRAAKAVGGIGKAAREAKAAADELQSIMDRLFPEVAKRQNFEKEMADLASAHKEGKLSAEQHAAAVNALRREYAGLHRDIIGALAGEDHTKIELTAGGETIEEMSRRVNERFSDTMERLADKAGHTKVQVVKSMQDMVTDMMSAFDRLASSLRGGSFLDILQAVIGVGLKLGDMGLFGKSIQTNLRKTPGYANGTNFHPGGLAIVGERGRELVNMPRGSQVKTNSELNSMMRDAGRRDVLEIVDTTGLFRFKVGQQILEASPAIMDGSARVTASRAGRRQMRRLA